MLRVDDIRLKDRSATHGGDAISERRVDWRSRELSTYIWNLLGIQEKKEAV